MPFIGRGSLRSGLRASGGASALKMRITFLGTGTSHGVPSIGCRCETCVSTDPRDRRWRPSLLVQGASGADGAGRSILIDTATDLREQALRFRVERVDAILFTHSHADHVMGLDDVRRYNMIQRAAIPIYGDCHTLAQIRRMFAYIFDDTTFKGGDVPELVPHVIDGPFTVGGLNVVPVPVLHGELPVLGFRFGSFAYLTDCSRIPEGSWPLIAGVQVLVVDALRRRPHRTHFSVDEALEVVGRVRPQRAYFTHICHDLPHEATNRSLPRGVELAFDGLVLELPEQETGR